MNKTKMRKSVLSLLLAVSMIVTSSAPVAFAETNDELVNWKTLQGLAGGNKSILPDSIEDAVVSGDKIITAGILDQKGITVEGGKGDRDAVLSMYNADGSLVWETYTGGSKQDYFYAVTEGIYGGYVAVGGSKSDDGDFAIKNTSNYDAVIAKYDTEGKLLKQASFGGKDKEEFNAVVPAFDGGYVAVGFSQSADGDMEGLTEEGSPRNGIIVKYDADLNLQWAKAVGEKTDLSATKIVNEFESVVADPEGNFLVAGTTTAMAAGRDDLNNGSKNGLIAKISSEGELLWTKTYGGTADDEIKDIEGAHLFTSGETTEGYILTGTTESTDMDFADAKTGEAEAAFIMKIDKDGNIEWKNTLESSAAVEGSSVHTAADGFFMTGQFAAADGDFTGAAAYGKEDIFVAYYSLDGYFREMHTVGGDDKDLVNGMITGQNNDYILFGRTQSADSIFGKIQGPSDGFLASIKQNVVEEYATEKYLVPVTAFHLTEDKPSMMAPLLYKDAYVEKTGELYTVTLYFTNAQLMGSQVNSSTLGPLSYEFEGEMVPAVPDEYNPTKQIKVSTIKSKDLTKKINVHIEDTMGDIRIGFEPDKKVTTEVPPYFPDIEVSQPDFKADYKFTTGGTDYDYTYDMAVLEDGNLAITGQTFSFDMDMQFHKGAAANGYISVYTPEGELVHTTMIGGDRPSTRSYVQGVIPCDDGGYIAGGCFMDAEDPTPNGDFLPFADDKDKKFGKTDTFFARYDKNHKLIWMDTFSGSDHDQLKSMIADKDGYVAIVETFSSDGDMEGQYKGLADLAIVKYSFEGEKQWQTVVGGVNIESTRTGLDILSNGNYILAGHASSKIGDFEGQQAYGDLFDLFAAEIDREGNIKWVKNYGGNKNDYCYTVEATSDGGFIIGGNTKSTTDHFQNTGTSYDNAYVMKMDAEGEVQWSDVIKSSEASEVTSILEQGDHYVVLGETRGTDFDFKDMNRGSMDTFLADYSKEGKRLSLETIGGSKEDYPAKIMEINDYQNGILTHSISNDGDLKGRNRGGYDGTVFVYSFAEKPVTPETPDNPETPDVPERPELPEGQVTPDQDGSVTPDKTPADTDSQVQPEREENGTKPVTGDSSMIYLWLSLLLGAAIAIPSLKKRIKKMN